MQVTFIRHGESESNVAGRWQGQGDSPLSSEGQAQARALARRLADVPFDWIVSSDLSRAAATADALGRKVERDPAWRELDIGYWEGLTRAEVQARYPEEVVAMAEDLDRPMGGGESWRDLQRRVMLALDAVRTRFEGDEHVAVVAHGGVIMTTVLSLLGILDRRPRALGRLVNTATTTVEFDGDRVRLLRYNDCAHAPQRAEGGALVRIEASAVAEPEGLGTRLRHTVNARGRSLAAPGQAIRRFLERELGLRAAARLATPLRGADVLSIGDRFCLVDWEVGVSFGDELDATPVPQPG